MKLSDYVMKFLEEKGVSDIFYLPGGGCMHLINSLGHSNLNAFSLLHEQSVAIAAESYAMTSQKTGVALVTTGPGGTNTVTGVLSSYVDSTPCFFLSGQVKTSDMKKDSGLRQLGSQEADIVSIVKSITKYAVTLDDKNKIKYELEKAWYYANEGRKGPVWVDIPLDIQGSDVVVKKLESFAPPTNKSYFATNEQIDEIVNSLKEAKKPLIIAGNALRSCTSEFYSLIEKLNIPVIPTWKAMDLIGNDHPLYAGKCGTMGDRGGNFAVQNADVILSLGSKLDFSITGFERDLFAPNGKKIVIDVDESELNKLNISNCVKMKVDVKDVVNKLNYRQCTLKSYDNWIKKVKEWQEKYPVVTKEHFTKDKPISTYALIKTICDNIDENAVIVPASAGTTAEIAFQAFETKHGQKIRSNHGLGSMGYEIPSAIGAWVAEHKKVVCIAGDGGMQLNLQELAVISGRKLPIIIFVVNNNGYSSIRNMQRAHFEGFYVGSDQHSGLFLPDMCKVAYSYDIKSMEISKVEELAEKVKEALNMNEPVICNVIVEEISVVAPKVTATILSDGKMKSGELDDMFPYIEKEVFNG